MNPSVRLEGLSKSFGQYEVLSGIDLDVERGQVFGYLGPNGAGKSTTVRILAGMLGGFGGEANVLGFNVRKDPIEVKRRIGYIPENAALYESLTVFEVLQLVGRLHDISEADIARRGPVMLEAFGLEARRSSRISTLSKGMRQKVLITAGLLHDPELIFLDEPLSGLDVASTILVKDLIRSLAERGKTIFYCSHMMDVVERVCDRIVILGGGKIVADGTFEELAARSEEQHLEAIFAELTGGSDSKEAVGRILSALDDLR